MDSHTPQNDHIKLALTSLLLSGLSCADCNVILRSGHQKRFWPPAAIFCEGDPVQHVSALFSGCVKVTKLGIRREEVILRLVGMGELIGEILPFSGAKHGSTAQALQGSLVYAWEVSVFQQLLDRFPLFFRNVVQTLEQQTHELECRFREVSTEHVASRLSTELIRLSDRFGQRVDGHKEIHLSCNELAQMTGMTLHTVSRLLSQWQKSGAVSLHRERVQVRDTEALRQISSANS